MEIKTKNTILKVEKFDPLTATKEDWARYHAYRRKNQLEENPNDPLSDDTSAEVSIKTNVQHPEAEISIYSIIDNKTDKQIGEYHIVLIRKDSPSFEGTKHLIQFDLNILSSYRKQGIGKKVLQFIYEVALKQGKRILVTSTDTPDGKAFLERIGAQSALAGVENRLNLNEVDWKMVETWKEEGSNRSPNTKIEIYETIPEEIIDQFCKIYTEVINQQPLGELDVGSIITTPESYRQQEKMIAEMGRKWTTIITKEPDGTISGLTEMRYNPCRETMINQILTGVKQEHRGRGLGKWLKAEMLLKVKEEFPKVEIVTTGNANVNAPMLSINNRLGFKVYKEQMNAQITLDKLAEYLN